MYLVQVCVLGNKYFGVANVGIRPTISGKRRLLEAHIFATLGEIYGQKITVEFLQFLRGEKRFASLELLTAQIQKDIVLAKSISA